MTTLKTILFYVSCETAVLKFTAGILLMQFSYTYSFFIKYLNILILAIIKNE